MFQLTPQNQEAAVRAISLKPGSYSLGRTPENDIAIPQPSVSSRHCLLTVNEHGVGIRDLGSTNGTFVNNQPVQEQLVYPGDSIRFGDEGFSLEAASASAVEKPAAPVPGKLGLSLPVRAEAQPPRPPMDSPFQSSAIKRIQAAAASKPEVGTFWVEMGRSFAYPFRSSGWLKLLAATLMFAVLDFGARFSFWVAIIGTGYLFAYIQSHITHSADGEYDPAEWPGFSSWWDDIIRPCLLYTLVGACSFAPLLIYLFFGAGEEPSPVVIFGLGTLGLLYLPMALLATAISDSFTGLNPVAVFPPIARLPLEYLALCGMLVLLVVTQGVFTFVVEELPIPYITYIAALPAGFLSLYLVTVTSRALGMLYCTKREKFGWFD